MSSSRFNLIAYFFTKVKHIKQHISLDIMINKKCVLCIISYFYYSFICDMLNVYLEVKNSGFKIWREIISSTRDLQTLQLDAYTVPIKAHQMDCTSYDHVRFA